MANFSQSCEDINRKGNPDPTETESQLFCAYSKERNAITDLSSESDEDSDDRYRTPSGTIITANVKKISSIFDSSKDTHTGGKKAKWNSQKATKSKRVTRAIERKLKTKAGQLVAQYNRESHRHGTVSRRQNKEEPHQLKNIVNSQPEDESSASEGYFTPKRVELSESDECDSEFLHVLASQLKTVTSVKMNTQQSQSASLNSVPTTENGQESQMVIEMDAEMSEEQITNPSAMSLVNVAAMFDQLRGDVQQLRKEVKGLQKEDNQRVSEVVIERCKKELEQTMTFLTSNETKDNEVLKADLKHCKFKNNALTNIVEMQSVEINDLKARIDALELNAVKNAVSISGLNVDGKKRDCILQIEEFVGDALGLNVTVEDFFRIGSSQPKTLVIHLQTAQQKREVLHFKKHLKGNTNYRNPIYINDYVPANTVEKRRKEREIKEVNSRQETPLDISFSRGKMLIQGEIYKPPVSVPTPIEVVGLTPKELEKILKLPISQTGKVSQDMSVFQGFAADVKDHQQVREYYIKMKLMEPMAKHIVCAYWVDGHLGQDYCDDGEAAAGKVLMDILQKQKLKNKVVFVSRKYGGQKMGASRFECYRAAAEVVLKANPWNDVLKMKQPWIESYRTVSKNEAADRTSSNNTDITSEKRPASSPPDVSQQSQSKRQNNAANGRNNNYRGSRSGSWGRGQNRQRQLNTIRGRAGYSTQHRFSREPNQRWSYQNYDSDFSDSHSFRREQHRNNRREDWDDYYDYERNREQRHYNAD